jgi:4-amino-4-deoxy-L-arabinose transferase-like glycosyltransferase
MTATKAEVPMIRQYAGVRVDKLVYTLALVASVSLWLLHLRAPLWIDEMLAYWQIDGGFHKIWSRSAQMPSSFTYLYILWFTRSIIGKSEVALRIPSILAMLGAAYALFRAARELFHEEIALISCILFCIHDRLIFAATDARPYAFALLMTNLAILAFVLWIRRHEMRYALQFGAAMAGIVYFQYLFAVAILPAFGVSYLLFRGRFLKEDVRQLAAMLVLFSIMILPQIPRFVDLFRNRQTHVFGGQVPTLLLLETLVPLKFLIIYGAVLVIAVITGMLSRKQESSMPGLLCLLLAGSPAAFLYILNALTSTHVSHQRYWLVAVPGSILVWGWLIDWIDSGFLRKIFCLGVVAVTLFRHVTSPSTGKHEISFKKAHTFVNANVAKDHAPVLTSSAFVESKFQSMPPGPENALSSQLSYYPLNTQVTFLPMTMNDEAMRVGREFMFAAAQHHQRFLMIAIPQSYPTLKWLADYSSGKFAVRTLGNFDTILVVEFSPLETD